VNNLRGLLSNYIESPWFLAQLDVYNSFIYDDCSSSLYAQICQQFKIHYRKLASGKIPHFQGLYEQSPLFACQEFIKDADMRPIKLYISRILPHIESTYQDENL